MSRILSAFAAILVTGATTTAHAETGAERDARRATYVEGFSCWFSSNGQSVRVVYSKNGVGEFYYSHDQIQFSWKVENDKFCRTVRGNERCSDLPPRDIGDEAAKFEAFLLRGCD